jgi:hypothetical protein
MNFQTVQSQLENLPNTYLRPGTPFTQWMDSITAGLTRDTGALDQISIQISDFINSRFGWVDIWGLLFNVPRFPNEPDQYYIARIAYEVMAGGGPPVAICAWVLAVWRINIQIIENLPAVGYKVIFPATLTTLQIEQILNSLVRIRPAGVPITIAAQSVDGLYLQTINFCGAADVTGAYLADQASTATVTLNESTNNTPPSLPDLFLTDPTLNPGQPPLS